MGGSSTTVEAPKPTAQEIELQQMQLDQIKRQEADQELFRPFMLEQMGFEQSQDGTITKLPEDEVTRLMKERQLAALRGELPVSPALEHSFDQREDVLEETLSRRLGRDYESTTSGIQALRGFQQNKDLVLEEARRGMLPTTQQLLMGQQGLQTGGMQQLSPYSQGNTSQDFMAGLDPYQKQRQAVFQASIANAQNEAQSSAGLLGMVGTLGGAALGTKWFS